MKKALFKNGPLSAWVLLMEHNRPVLKRFLNKATGELGKNGWKLVSISDASATDRCRSHECRLIMSGTDEHNFHRAPFWGYFR